MLEKLQLPRTSTSLFERVFEEPLRLMITRTLAGVHAAAPAAWPGATVTLPLVRKRYGERRSRHGRTFAESVTASGSA